MPDLTLAEFKKLADESGLDDAAKAILVKAFVEVRRRTLLEAIALACGSCGAGLVPVRGRVNDAFPMYPEAWVHVSTEDPRARWTCMAGPLYDALKELE